MKSTDQFKGINLSVETIRLIYLLLYPVHKIQPIFRGDESKEEAVKLLASKISMMIQRVHSEEICQLTLSPSSSPVEQFTEWRDTIKSKYGYS